MSYLLVPDRITIPLSITISILIFGLTKYYDGEKEQSITNSNNAQKIEKTAKGSIANIIFVVTYVFFLAILVNSSSSGASGLFIDWEKIAPIQVLDIIAAIAFSFFLPGYALVTILNKKYKLRLLLKLLLAYLFSMLIAGFGGYVSGSFGYAISNTNVFFIGSYLLLFLFYLQQVNALSIGLYRVTIYRNQQSLAQMWNSLLNNYSQFIVFSSLLALVIIFTYYLNDGEIVVDQWYHHGRALSIGSGLFKELGPSDVYIPPFFSSLLAAFFNLSGSPSVNAYVAISFLNIVPVFAFYYFFTNWIPKNKQRAALLASTLFMLSSGFGWLYAINTAESDHNQVTFDVSSSVNVLSQAYSKTFDIETPTTFINVGHPDVTTALIIIALPAGFVLLGLIKEVELYDLNNGVDKTSRRSKSTYLRILTCIAVITAVTFLGILSHDEFFLFIIVASISMVILFRQLPKNVNYSIFFISFLSAIILVILVDIFISPAGFYTARHILGPPLVIVVFLIVSFNWTLYLIFRKIKFSNIFNNNRIKTQIKIIIQPAKIKKITTLNFLNERQIRLLKLSLGMVIVLIVAYLYLITLLVWNALSVDDISSQIKEFANVPWYLLPVKFGLTGLLGLAFILSYIFKKFEKEVFIFGIIIIIAFLAGPYYDEHRFGKYIMAGMAAFAALLIYQIISSRRIGHNLKLKALIVGIMLGIVVTASGLSIFMFAGWVELFTGKSDWIEGGRRDFPVTSEIDLLNFLNNKIIHTKAYNIALPEKETTNGRGFVTKIYGFSPTSRVNLLESPLTLNSSTMEGLYSLLNNTDVRYIILPKKDIFVDTEKEGIISSGNHSYSDNISSVMRFVLDNFPKAYEDQNYIILEVLPFTPPITKDSNVAFVYQGDSADLLPPVSNNSTILPMDFGLFGSQTVDNNTKNYSNYYKDIVVNDSKEGNKKSYSTYSLILGDKVNKNDGKSITLWSHPIQQIQERNALNSSDNNKTVINYIEGNFRIIDDLPAQNKSEKRYADKFGAGIVWEHGNNTYLASVNDVGLQLSKSPSKITLSTKQPEQANNTDYLKQVLSKLILSQNEEVKRQKGIWYNLKILFLENNVEIYLNDILRMKVPVKVFSVTSSDERNITDSISRVGINSYFSKSEFQPIILGQIRNISDHSYTPYQKIYYRHYYPLNTLALSKIKYDAYEDGDLSAFSKNYVVLPFDKALHEKNEANKYLEYVSKGGNLIVINSDNNFDGVFSKLLLIKPGNLNKFNSIGANDSDKIGEKNYSLNVSGIARGIEISSNNDLTVKSYYANKGESDKYQNVAPFVLEKNYGNGKIIFVNAKGYFDSLFGKTYSGGNNTNTSDIKNQYFTTLSKFATIIGISGDGPYVHKNSHPPAQFSTSRIIGDIKIYPEQNIVINSSYLQFQDSNSESKKLSSYNLTASDVYVSADHSKQISLTNHRLSNNNSASNETNHNIKPTQRMTDNADASNVYDFKEVLINDLKLYGGPFEILINVTNSTRSLYLPTSLSHNDYIGASIPKGFDMTIKLLDSNSTYAQVDMIKKNDKNSFQRIKVSGYNNDSSNSNNSTGEILFYNVKSDIQAIRYISALIKNPEIKIIGDYKSMDGLKPVQEETRSLRYYLDSPDSTPIEIQRGSGYIKIDIDHVDNYDEHYHDWTRTRFITYLKNDVQIYDDDNKIINRQVNEQNLFAKLLAKRPGDISEYAKEHGIEVPWRDVISSTPSVAISLSLIAVFVIVVTLTWSKITRLKKVK